MSRPRSACVRVRVRVVGVDLFINTRAYACVCVSVCVSEREAVCVNNKYVNLYILLMCVVCISAFMCTHVSERT